MYICVCFAMTLALVGGSVNVPLCIRLSLVMKNCPAPNANSGSVEKY